MSFRFAPAVLLVAAVLLGSCGESEKELIERDLADIRERDTLVVLTTFNSTSYFLYRGTPMGFEYEILRMIATDLGLEFQTVVEGDREAMFGRLRAGDGDIVSGRIVPTRDARERIAFTRPLYATSATIVQQTEPLEEAHLPEIAQEVLGSSGPTEIRARPVSDVADLVDETVHVARGTAPHLQLVELSDRLTGDVYVVAVEPSIHDEALIRGVATGEYELAATHEELAKLKEGYLANITVEPVVGDSFYVVFGVRENSPDLLDVINRWIEANQKRLDALYRKYFIDRRGYRERVASEFLTSETGRLSPYDHLLQRYAEEIGWDWRLLAAMAYQESRFNPRARSWAGAMGLLQLMPRTARQYGVLNAWDPAQNVAGAVRFIQWLEDYWENIIPDEAERRRFILASYNTGHGHVQDARRLAAKYGGSDQNWADVAKWLLRKSEREVFTDPVVQFGFSRGLEPVTYVKHILERYEHFLEFVTDVG